MYEQYPTKSLRVVSQKFTTEILLSVSSDRRSFDLIAPEKDLLEGYEVTDKGGKRIGTILNGSLSGQCEHHNEIPCISITSPSGGLTRLEEFTSKIDSALLPSA